MADQASDKKPGDAVRRRRGRPPGSTTKKRRRLLASAAGESQPHFGLESDVPLSSQHSHKLSQRYQEAAKQYEKTRLNQRILHIIRRMACGRVFAMETQRGPVQQYLMDVSKLLFLNELELVVWDLYLRGTQWINLPMSFQTLLVVSGYYVKSVMSVMETPHILAYLSKQIPQFHAFVSLWVNCCCTTYSVNPKELFQHYRLLLTPIREDESNQLNYNYYVDDIINLGCATVDEIAASVPVEPFTIQEAETEPNSFVQLPVPVKIRDDLSPLIPMEDFCFSPMLFHYPFPYYSPPQSALPVLEDLESAQLRPAEK